MYKELDWNPPLQMSVLKAAHVRATWYKTVRSASLARYILMVPDSAACSFSSIAPPVCLAGVYVYSKRAYACFKEVT